MYSSSDYVSVFCLFLMSLTQVSTPFSFLWVSLALTNLMHLPDVSPEGYPGHACLHAAGKLRGGGCMKSLVSLSFLLTLLFRANFITWFYSLASQWRNISWFRGFRKEVLILLKAKVLLNFTSTFSLLCTVGCCCALSNKCVYDLFVLGRKEVGVSQELPDTL